MFLAHEAAHYTAFAGYAESFCGLGGNLEGVVGGEIVFQLQNKAHSNVSRMAGRAAANRSDATAILESEIDGFREGFLHEGESVHEVALPRAIRAH